MSIRNRKRKPTEFLNLSKITPLTMNQKKFFDSYSQNKNIIAHGVAGTGKTFIALYNALKDVLDYKTPYSKIYIIRSLVPTREIGFLPGSHEDKASLYEIPYKNMVKDMFDTGDDSQLDTLYTTLKLQGLISFWSTSFIRGTTFDNSILIVDEFENLNGHECDSIITRVGQDSKIIFCGDSAQTDLTKEYEKRGMHDFMKIVEQMPSFDIIDFQIEDICRSGFVKEYLTTKYKLNITI